MDLATITSAADAQEDASNERLTRTGPRQLPAARGYSSIALSNCLALKWYPLSMLRRILSAVERPS